MPKWIGRSLVINPRRDMELATGGVLLTAAGLGVSWFVLLVPQMQRYWMDVLLATTALMFFCGIALVSIGCCRFLGESPFFVRIIEIWDAMWTQKRAVFAVVAIIASVFIGPAVYISDAQTSAPPTASKSQGSTSNSGPAIGHDVHGNVCTSGATCYFGIQPPAKPTPPAKPSVSPSDGGQRIGLSESGFPCTGGEGCNFDNPRLKEPPAPCPEPSDPNTSLFCNFGIWGEPTGDYSGTSAFGFYGNGKHNVEMHGVRVQGLTKGDAVHVHEGQAEINLDSSSLSGNGVGIEAPADTKTSINATNNSHIDNNGTAVKLTSAGQPPVTVTNSPNSIIAPSGGTNTINNYGSSPPPPHLGNFVERDPVANGDGTYSWRIRFDTISDSVPQNMVIIAKGQYVMRIEPAHGPEGRLMFNTSEPTASVPDVHLFKLDSPTGAYAFDVVTSSNTQKPIVGYAFNVRAGEQFSPNIP